MGEITQFIWLGFLAAAYLVRKTKRANTPLIVGLVGMGIPSLLATTVNMELLPRSLFHDLRSVFALIQPVSVLLLLFGVVRLVTSGSGSVLASGGTADAAGERLSTLFIPRNDTNTYSRAETLRDAACARLMATARLHDIGVIEQKSDSYSATVWFRLDYLLPQPRRDLSLRAHVQVTIERFDYHRFEHLYTLIVQVGTETKRINGILAFDDTIAHRITKYVVESGYRLEIPERVREAPWQLWRPKNNVDRIGLDWAAIGGLTLGILMTFVPQSASALASTHGDGGVIVSFMGWLVAIGIFVALYLRRKRRRTYVLTTGKPQHDPRSLRWMDSWQATVGGLGPAAVQVSDGVMSRIGTSAPPDMSIGVERVGYWSVDSRVERDQVAIRYRRALGFIQIVPHGSNLYVSWECHLNAATWAEQTLARGMDRVSGLDVQANRIVSGIQLLNEYDLADANFLAEWIHESVKQVLKLKMAEHQIDQEIDFTIQRESRKEILGSSGEGRQAPEQKSRAGALKRVA